jgi:hypothetical protein
MHVSSGAAVDRIYLSRGGEDATRPDLADTVTETPSVLMYLLALPCVVLVLLDQLQHALRQLAETWQNDANGNTSTQGGRTGVLLLGERIRVLLLGGRIRALLLGGALRGSARSDPHAGGGHLERRWRRVAGGAQLWCVRIIQW